jgi:hypothetical protein
MGGGFAEAFAVVGGLVLASSALSRITRRTILDVGARRRHRRGKRPLAA